MVAILQNKREAIAELCARHGVARLEFSAPLLRDDFHPGESDIDLLVEFGPHEGTRWSMPTSACSRGYAPCWCEVDLVMADAVKNRYIAREIERTKQLLYAA